MKTVLGQLADKFTVGDDCWEWTAGKRNGRYGHVRIDGKYITAHNVLYELLVGPVPLGLELDHTCRNPACVRPAHLEPVTHHENTLRGNSPAAVNARKTHCPQGHEYDAANTRVYRGRRYCRACKTAEIRRYRARKKAAA